MTSLLSRIFGRSRKGSGTTAKDRLRFVLQHDRINLPPERMEQMKAEILAVIAKYLVVDQERVEMALEQRDRMHSKLIAEIPVAKEQHGPPKSAASPNAQETNGAEDIVAAENGADDSAKAGQKDDENDTEDAKPEVKADDAEDVAEEKKEKA